MFPIRTGMQIRRHRCLPAGPGSIVNPLRLCVQPMASAYREPAWCESVAISRTMITHADEMGETVCAAMVFPLGEVMGGP